MRPEALSPRFWRFWSQGGKKEHDIIDKEQSIIRILWTTINIC
jgi:phenylalanine-4-hydroxylase